MVCTSSMPKNNNYYKCEIVSRYCHYLLQLFINANWSRFRNSEDMINSLPLVPTCDSFACWSPASPRAVSKAKSCQHQGNAVGDLSHRFLPWRSQHPLRLDLKLKPSVGFPQIGWKVCQTIGDPEIWWRIMFLLAMAILGFCPFFDNPKCFLDIDRQSIVLNHSYAIGVLQSGVT